MIGLDIKIEGEQVLSRVLDIAAKDIKDFSRPLQESNSELLKSFQLNFDARGSMFGGWAARKPQMAHGERMDTWPLLEKSGDMRNQFRPDVSATTLVIGNDAPYFKYHQSNQSRTRLPRRIMMMIDDARKAAIVRAFQRHVQDVTRGRK